MKKVAVCPNLKGKYTFKDRSAAQAANTQKNWGDILIYFSIRYTPTKHQNIIGRYQRCPQPCRMSYKTWYHEADKSKNIT